VFDFHFGFNQIFVLYIQMSELRLFGTIDRKNENRPKQFLSSVFITLYVYVTQLLPRKRMDRDCKEVNADGRPL